MSTNNSSCHTFSEKELNTIFYTRIGVVTVTFLACLVTLILMCVLICYMKVWKTLVHRLKLYLSAVALVLSVMYLLQVLPIKSQEVQKEPTGKTNNWNEACKGITFLLQYVEWIMLLMICWMIIYLLWLTQPLLYGSGKAFNIFSYKNKVYFEITAIFFTLAFPLLFLWTPFSTDNYGLENIWCGIILRKDSDCSNESGSLARGLAYLVGIWYGPSFIVVLLCAVGVIVVVCCLWIYYKKKGRTKYMTSAILRGIPPAVYLVIYNVITCIDITSLLIHYTASNVTRGGAVDYHLWLTHAVTGPSRALAVPFAFVLSHFLIHYCFRRKEESYQPLQ